MARTAHTSTATPKSTHIDIEMTDDLSGDAFVKALDSEKVMLVVSERQVNISISEGILAQKAPVIDARVKEWEGEKGLEKGVDMRDQAVNMVKMFVQWCYKERLPTIDSTSASKSQAAINEQRRKKEALMDLWIFAGQHEITKLQNEAMHSLIHVLDNLTLLTLDDIRLIWDATAELKLTDELCQLSIFALVARVQNPDDKGMRIKHLNELSGLDGIVGDVYFATEKWTRFSGPMTPKKGQKSKWIKFTEDKAIVRELMAEEKVVIDVDGEETPPPPPAKKGTPKKAPTKDAEVEKAAVVGVKRERVEEVPAVRVKMEEGEDTVRVPNAFREVEMIDLTDD